MKLFLYPINLLSLGTLIFFLGACAQAQGVSPLNQDQYSYQVTAADHWQIKAARITPTNEGAGFTAKVFHRHKRALYSAADLQLRIVDVSGKLIGTVNAKPEQVFDAEKAWRKTGVHYSATLDFVPPPGSQIQLLIASKK